MKIHGKSGWRFRDRRKENNTASEPVGNGRVRIEGAQQGKRVRRNVFEREKNGQKILSRKCE
jgi:hypothetical protein